MIADIQLPRRDRPAVENDPYRLLGDKAPVGEIDPRGSQPNVVTRATFDSNVALQSHFVVQTVVDAPRGAHPCRRGVRRPELGIDAEEFEDVRRCNVLGSGTRLDLKGAAVRLNTGDVRKIQGDLRTVKRGPADGNVAGPVP